MNWKNFEVTKVNIFGWAGFVLGGIYGFIMFGINWDTFWTAAIGTLIGGFIGLIINKLKK